MKGHSPYKKNRPVQRPDILLEQLFQGLQTPGRNFEIIGFKPYTKPFFDVDPHLSRFVPDDECGESKRFHFVEITEENSTRDPEDQWFSNGKTTVIQQ